MFVQLLATWRRVRASGVAVCVFVMGCGDGLGLTGTTQLRPTLSLSTLGADGAFIESASNNLIDTAELVEVGAESRTILGRISGSDDVDVYDLGPVEVGDRVIVDMTNDGSLDPVLALFDDMGSALLINDHRNVYLGTKQPFVDVVIRRRMNSCYVAVAATPGYGDSGDYGLVASIEPRSAIPLLRSERVLLVFNGGNNVTISTRPAVNVPAFNAANIDSSFAGYTDELVDEVVAGIRSDYRGFAIDILSTSEGTAYDGAMTRIYFGTYDAALLGVAQGVDEFNATPNQSAIVFTDTFQAFMRLDPTVEEMGQAIANVATHEIGHLLGLVHTSDPAGIMDVTASLSQLMLDQDFRKSPLYLVVFPIGHQDGVQSLLASIGGDSFMQVLKLVDFGHSKTVRDLDPDGTPARAEMAFSGCSIGLHGH